jgi:hypothetical protein
MPAVTQDSRSLYRAGAVSASLLVLGYVVIIALYVPIGAAPAGGEAKLAYLEGKTAAWRAILGLSVITDLLYAPIAVALYAALVAVNRTAMLIGAGLLLLFVALDLAVTWPNYAALIDLSARFAASATEQRAVSVAAASYAAAVLESALEAAYSIGVPSLGILVIGLVMRRSAFGPLAAYLGILTGVAGLIAVFGPGLTSALGASAVVAALLTTIWVMVVGYRLYQLSR